MLILATEITGFFSFLNPILVFLQNLGHVGLAIYTFFEVLLIIPPIETLYYPMILTDVNHWYLYFLNVVFFNVIASMFGYFVGMKIGYPVLRYFTNDDVLKKAHTLFERWGILAVALGAFTPVPYTIVVFLAGITRMDFKKFVLAGMLGRIPRYLIGGYVIVYVVREINSPVLQQYLLIASVIGMLLFILYYILQGVYNYYKRQQAS